MIAERVASVRLAPEGRVVDERPLGLGRQVLRAGRFPRPPERVLVEVRAVEIDAPPLRRARLAVQHELDGRNRVGETPEDDGGLTLFLAEEGDGVRPAPTGSVFLTLQVAAVDAQYRELAARGIEFAQVPQKLFWGYGAERLDPDGARSDDAERRSLIACR